MADQLSVYNGALLHCAERFLSSLTEQREPRRLLDRVWASNGVKTCLEAGQWNFAMRTVQIDYDPSIEPDFGYGRAFQKPDDWVLTSALCSDEFFREPLLRYVDESGYWYSDLDTLYVRFVSDDTNYGMDMNKWPDSFREFVEAHFASKIVLKLTTSEAQTATVMEARKNLLKTAKSRAAMADPTSFPARGNWVNSRNRSSPHRDGGNTSGSLY